MTQHHAEYVGAAALAIGPDNHGAGAKIHLGFLAGGRFHPPERDRDVLAQVPQEALDAVVAGSTAAVTMFQNEVLVDAPAAETLGRLLLDDGAEGFTGTGRPGNNHGRPFTL